MPLTRVRALSTELAACFVNKRSEGFWNRAPKNMGGRSMVRLVPRQAPSSAPVPPQGGAWRLWAARHSQGETRPLGSVPATTSGARASLRGGKLHGV